MMNEKKDDSLRSYSTLPVTEQSVDALEDRQEHHMFTKDGKRCHFLDIAKIGCVIVVTVNHGGTSWCDHFGLWNVMFVQQWLLQWLFILAGISFAISSRDTAGYLARLSLYFAIGVFTNWCAYVIKGMDWRGNFWNVIFQFWFIFGLMVYITILTPLKRHLEAVAARVHRLPAGQDVGFVQSLIAIGFALILVHLCFRLGMTPLINYMVSHALIDLNKHAGAGGAFWGLPSNIEQSNQFVQELLSYIQVSVGSMVILWLFPKISNRLPLANWLVLLNIFIFRCFAPRDKFARGIDGFDFTLIGLASYYLGLSYRRTIGRYMCRYWFVLLFIFSLLVPPGTWGRFDETPITDFNFRIRYHLVELAFVLLFLCAAERLLDGQIFSEDGLEWLNWFSLYLFLSHKFIHIVVPNPFNWLVVCLVMPIAWAIHGRRIKTPDGKSSQGSLASASGSHDGQLPQPRADLEKALEHKEPGQGQDCAIGENASAKEKQSCAETCQNSPTNTSAELPQ